MAENVNLPIVPLAFDSEFGQLRTIEKDGDILFAGVDACRILEIKNSRDAMTRLKDNEKMTVALTDGHSGKRGGAQKITFVTEPGLYRLIFASHKKEAENFQDYVYHTLLPDFRKKIYGVAGKLSFKDIKIVKAADKIWSGEPFGGFETDITGPGDVCVRHGDLRILYRYIFRTRFEEVPYIYFPKYWCGNLVFTRKDMMKFLDVSELSFTRAFKCLADKFENGWLLLSGEKLKTFVRLNPIGRVRGKMYIFSREMAFAFFDYFELTVPEDLKKVYSNIKEFDTNFVGDFINDAINSSSRLSYEIQKFAEEMVECGVCLR